MESALFITSKKPDENGVGIEQRAYRNLTLLQKKYSTTVVLINTNAEITVDSRYLSENAIVINLNIDFAIPERLRKLPGGNFLWFASQKIRYKWYIYKARKSILKKLKTVSDIPYTLVFFFRLNTIWLAPFLKKLGLNYQYSLVDFDDIESIAIKRELATDKQRIGKQKYCASMVNLCITRYYENKALNQFDIVTVCSEHDKQNLEQRKHTAHVAILPNTIREIDLLPPNPSESQIEILFVGLLNYAPNIDAINFFCKHILPVIKESTDFEVKVTIIGREPDAEIYKLTSIPDVTLFENVPSVLPYYRKCNFLVVPLRAGGGTRLKILEAMSYGRPVVSTSIGAEGLGAKHLEHLLIADEPEEFANACIKLSEDTELYNNICKNGRQFVDKNYGVDSVSIAQLLPPQSG